VKTNDPREFLEVQLVLMAYVASRTQIVKGVNVITIATMLCSGSSSYLLSTTSCLLFLVSFFLLSCGRSHIQ